MTTINGLPAHVLLVHVVVVLIPLTALLLLVGAFWPVARRRLAIPAAVLAVVSLIAVPLTTSAGEWLEHRLPSSALLRAHTELGDDMLPWAIGLAVVALAVAAREFLGARQRARAGLSEGPGAATAPQKVRREPGGRAATVVLAVLAVVVAVGSVGVVYRIGDTGARAAWEGKFSTTALPRTGPPKTGD